ncbi:MAG: hypothetical protein JEY94_00675 [Melioribacteraceae bacterium]|nr:hypothetical protein [Melioribacteraceae bacterium]
MKIINLKKILERLEVEQNNTNELNILINYSIKIALANLKTKYRNKVKNYSQTELYDISMDSIVSLFIKNPRGELVILDSAKKWKLGLNDHSDVDYFLHKIVWKSVQQTVYNIYKENDPVFDKINKTISTCINANNYSKTNYNGIIFVTKGENCKIDGKVIDEDEFLIIPAEYFLPKQEKLLEGLLNYISGELNYFPAIPFNLMIKRIKLLNQEFYSGFYEIYDPHISSKISIDEILVKCKSKLIKQLDVGYLNKNKLTTEECRAFNGAFDLIVIDLKNGGLHSSLYEYLSSEIKNLTKDDFYSKYHQIMNYLLKDFKLNIKEMLN